MDQITIKQVRAAREGGNVRRCHTVPHHGEYTVGKHSYDAANLLLFLNPDASVNLIKAVLWHDLGERWTGDVPYPAVRRDAEFAAAYRRLEKEGMERHGIKMPELTQDETNWLSCVDKLELLLWAYDQTALGNKMVCEYITVLNKWFEDAEAENRAPKVVVKFWRYYSFQRLSDM